MQLGQEGLEVAAEDASAQDPVVAANQTPSVEHRHGGDDLDPELVPPRIRVLLQARDRDAAAEPRSELVEDGLKPHAEGAPASGEEDEDGLLGTEHLSEGRVVPGHHVMRRGRGHKPRAGLKGYYGHRPCGGPLLEGMVP